MRQKIVILLSVAAGIYLFFSMNGVKDVHSSMPAGKTAGKADNRLIIAHKEIFGKLARPLVVFDHGLHSDKFRKEGCKTCHPAASDSDLVFAFPFRADAKEKSSLRDAYHRKCIGCHSRMIKEGGKTGPVRCGDCHHRERAYLAIGQPACEFDYFYHEKHVRSLKKRCILCHHSYNEELVYEEGTEQSCCYCHDEQKKRGLLLSVETELTLKKGLSIRKVSHSRCVNCHLDFSGKGEKAGPVECSKCHTGKYKTVSELANIPRPERDQPKKSFIEIEDAQMKGIPFDHVFHEKNVKTCKACHHETLNKCKECHGMKGSPKGRWINVAGAYHDVFSSVSCYGCHNIKKSEQNCAGCHHHLPDMDLQAKGPKKEICKVCHSGKKGDVLPKNPLAITMNAQEIPEKVTIRILEKEYEPSTFPHRKIIGKMIEISNDSKMAASFHRDIQTICRGCHHQSNTEAEAVTNKPPHCRNCHSLTFDQKNMNRPRLLAVYHRQCMGCHEKMKIKALGCTDCHKEKNRRPKDISSEG